MNQRSVSDQAKAVVRRSTEEVQGKGRFEVFEELFADDFVDDVGGRNATGESNQECSEARSRCLAVPVGRQRASWKTHLPQEGDRHSLPIPGTGFCAQVSHRTAERNQFQSSAAVPSADERR